MLAETNTFDVAPLVPLLPLLGTVVVGVFGLRSLKSNSHWPVIAGVAGALICSLIICAQQMMQSGGGQAAHPINYYSWIPTSLNVSVDVSFQVDALTAVMLAMVCTISLLVVIYSRDYMREHNHPQRGYERFFAFLGLFVFSMCTLVLSGNFLLLYLGWEAVGLCSYLLIGFYYQRPAAAAAAKKAFIVNRIGDFGFGIGILCIYLWISPLCGVGENPLDYHVVFDRVHMLETWQCTTIALLLFSGAVGKSAQLPLYVWLPDAMEGPSPVSALIHAATMVTAGVYMVVRCGPIFVQSEIALAVVAVIGAATALFAATIALAQYDVKRILAYSTISQLGYMFLGVGAYAADSAIFHLFTHAFFKALLFLGAGSVMHAMGGIIDVRRFGGLRRVLPATFIVFIIGAAALAGVPLLSAFFSKDEIIHAAFAAHPVLGWIGLITALLTAIYTFRMVFLTFWGEQRVPEGVHAHESGTWMIGPMIVLAFGAVFAGYLGVHVKGGGFLGFIEPHGGMHLFLEDVVHPYADADANPLSHGQEHGGHALMYISALLALAGIGIAYLLYVLKPRLAEKIRDASPQTYRLLHKKYYVDEFNDATVVQPLWRLGGLLHAVDRFVLDGIVYLLAGLPRLGGSAVRVFQNGVLQSYAVTMTGGLVLIVLIVWLIVW